MNHPEGLHRLPLPGGEPLSVEVSAGRLRLLRGGQASVYPPLMVMSANGRRHPLRAPKASGEVYRRFDARLGSWISLRTLDIELDLERFNRRLVRAREAQHVRARGLDRWASLRSDQPTVVGANSFAKGCAAARCHASCVRCRRWVGCWSR